MAAVAAAVAGTAGIAAYLNGKYHLVQDLKVKRKQKQAAKYYADLVARNKLSTWYTFSQHVPGYQNELCIWSREKSYTWQEAHDRAAQWAQFFLSQGVQPGEMVATYLLNSADFVVIWLGLWCIGCAPALINSNLKGDALVHCLKVSGVKLVLVDADSECQERFSEVQERVQNELRAVPVTVTPELMTKIYASPVDVPTDYYRSFVKAETPTCLLYTSGTTGLPKAGMYDTKRYHGRGNPMDLPYEGVPGAKGDRWYCCMPLFHGTGGMACMSALSGGISVAVGKKFSVSNFWNDIHDSDSTIFVYVGEAARYLLMAPPHPLERNHPRLRAMYGNGIRPDVWNRFQERFQVPQVIEFFNSTEGVLGMANHCKGPFKQHCVGQQGWLLRRDLHDVYVPVGIDPETGDVIRNPKTGFVERKSYNEGGEIFVRIPNEQAFAGYYNNPEATAKKFERDVFAKGDLFYRSGDALRRDDDGRWFFLDRLGDTYRWKSENVSTAEVAEVLGHYPGVFEAMVYGVLVPKHDGRAGCVGLRLTPDVKPEAFDWKAFLAYARSKLPKYGVPVFVRLVSDSSKTDNNKQNKAPLKDEGIELERYGEKVPGGGQDVVMWVPPGGNTYVRFDQSALEKLRGGRAVL